MLAHISITKAILLPGGQENLITWDKTIKDEAKHHTKKEYLKILRDGKYEISYQIKWQAKDTTQPLQVTIYKVTKVFELINLHQHVTVCTGNPVNLRKKFPFDLKAVDRVCIGIKNFSSVEFHIREAQLSLTQL